MIHSDSNVIVVDWGTTNFRAFLLDGANSLIDSVEANVGLLSVTDGNFASALESVLKEWLPEYMNFPIVFAGMVGSAKGWHNVDYIPSPANASDLSKELFVFNLPWEQTAAIVPGVCHTSAAGKDVMRGEEIQIFGLSQVLSSDNFDAVFPGTHSKHVTYQNNRIVQFSTYMTGEIFSLLVDHSILGKGIESSATFKEAAFLKGADDALDGQLSNRLFLARTHMLFNSISNDEVADYLSGMLIAHELQSKIGKNLVFVGSENLNRRYEIASHHLDIQSTSVDGNACFVAGISEIVNQLRQKGSTSLV